MGHKTDDLLRPQARVFTKARRPWGPLSLGLGLLSALVLTVVYAAFSGELVPDGRVMLGLGIAGAVLLPLLLVLRLRAFRVRIFAAVNVALGLLLFTALGGPTDAVLARNGAAPFEALDAWAGGRVPMAALGRDLVGLLRALSLGGASDAPDAPAGVPVPEAEPASPEAGGAGHASASRRLPLQAALQGVQPASGEEEGTFSVLSGGEPGTYEIPVTIRGRTVTVQALVEGRVPAEFVFDTGAETTAITPSLARELGHDPGRMGERRQFLTAGGPIEDPILRLSAISLGGAEVRDLEALVCTRCPRNLLGRDFQEHFRVELDGRAGSLRLHRR